MKTSAQGRALIMAREGCRLDAYQDSVGVWTIGTGHASGVVPGMTITREEADALLAEDLARFEKCINDNVRVALEQYEFDALVSWAFNVGAGAAATSTLVRLLNEHAPPAEVAAQFDRWHIPAEITSRRNAEKAQFLGEQFVARLEKEQAYG